MEERLCQFYERKVKTLSDKIISQDKLLNDLKKQVHNRIHNIECRLQFISQIQKLKIPIRNRRKNSEIVKRYQCEVPGCEKMYGSVSAVKNHTKLKHPLHEKDLYWKDLHDYEASQNICYKDDDQKSGEQLRQVEVSQEWQFLEDLYKQNSSDDLN